MVFDESGGTVLQKIRMQFVLKSTINNLLLSEFDFELPGLKLAVEFSNQVARSILTRPTDMLTC